MEDEAARDRMVDFINQLVSGPEAGDRNFIFIKVVHSVEEIIDRKTKQFWPAELAMTAFSLKGGIKAIYTQLIDTCKTLGVTTPIKQYCILSSVFSIDFIYIYSENSYWICKSSERGF